MPGTVRPAFLKFWYKTGRVFYSAQLWFFLKTIFYCSNLKGLRSPDDYLKMSQRPIRGSQQNIMLKKIIAYQLFSTHN